MGNQWREYSHLLRWLVASSMRVPVSCPPSAPFIFLSYRFAEETPVDLLSFDAEPLYFDNPPSEEVVQLLQQAAEDYSDGKAEADLQQAYQLAPEHLMVLVSLFRYYYYQHRFPEALDITQKTRDVVRHKLRLPEDWRTLSERQLFDGHEHNMVMVRFYLLCLKGEAYLYARQGEVEKSIPMLEKVAALDTKDYLGAGALLAVVRNSPQ
jgi:tetratricopeptide (TPR) repeat protein